MDPDGPHRSTRTTSGGSTSELFVCFTSRLSSSSMKISGKSILSPARSRDPPVSLSTSLSRRLRTNGSIKGGGQASPMFPTGGKKRGCGFENPEPSSPKVTCIGQVRVKSKKKARQTRSLSRRRSGGEVSFRRAEHPRDGRSQNEDHVFAQMSQPATASGHYPQPQQECLPHRNQRWVHLPLTICEALRTFGAEFSCLFPCRSSCFSTNDRDKVEKAAAESSQGNGHSSCGAVFARWLVSLDGGKGREIELVVGGEDDRGTEAKDFPSLRNSRRHVFDDLGITDMKFEAKDLAMAEDEARVSVCVPPKNALLLMRCRSDPTRVAALANRHFEPPADEDDNEDCKEEEEEREAECEVNEEAKMENEGIEELPQNLAQVEVNDDDKRNPDSETETETETETELEMELKDEDFEEENTEEKVQICEEQEGTEHQKEDEEEEREEYETGVDYSSSEALIDHENVEIGDDESIPAMNDDSRESSLSHCSSVQSEEEEEGTVAGEAAIEEDEAEKEMKETFEEDEELTATHERSEPEVHGLESNLEEDQLGVVESEVVERESERHSTEVVERETEKSSALPDCLLLMMCEPKLSMEVSKETWVCSTDFIRRLPERPPAKPKGGAEESKKKVSTDSKKLPSFPANYAQHNPPLQQPPRSSCSLPAAAAAVAGVSMATMIEQKLVNAVGYEPFVLKRCKSEPMRTAAAKLAPEACFWNNRKLEPHRRSTLGVGAAGVGF